MSKKAKKTLSQNRTNRNVKAFRIKTSNVSAHAFKMPKRQFIGDSYNLNEKIKKILIRKIPKAFK